MPRNDRRANRANRAGQKIAQSIQNNMDATYSSIYSSTPKTASDSQNITTSINAKIDEIIDSNVATIGMPSVSKLYSRITEKHPLGSDNPEFGNSISQLFEDSTIMDDLYASFMDNRYLREMDNEYDTICKYMPKLNEALLVKKDNILSADYFSKDFAFVKNPKGKTEEETFNKRIADLKDKYDLIEKIDDLYDKTARYGERFVYIVPYKTAIARLLYHKVDSTLISPIGSTYGESSIDESNDIQANTKYRLTLNSKGFSILNENGTDEMHTKGTVLRESTEMVHGKPKAVSKEETILSGTESLNLNIELCNSGIIESVVRDQMQADERNEKSKRISITEAFRRQGTESNNDSTTIINEDSPTIDRFSSGNIAMSKNKYGHGQPVAKNIPINGNPSPGKYNSSSSYDSKANGTNSTTANEFPKIDTYGAVFRFLKREQVIPVYIDEICMGYYYIELNAPGATDDFMGFKNMLNDPLSAGNSRDVRTNFDAVNASKQDEAIKYVAGQLSQFIDKNFVNANQDLSKEIYMILKYNELFNNPTIDQIKITFVPPEDIIHTYFDMDEESHRGISDLAKALVPAKLYSSLYVTNAIMYLTRGFDKRIYYVKQNVDQNIAQNLLTVIQQIKQGNFGLRQFRSINSVLNMTGRFNDYVIPTTSSGDYPIQFDTMAGQSVDILTDFMNMLEEMAINAVDIPYELIQSRQSVDYATQLSMSNTKFLRICYKRQGIFQKFLSEIFTRLYNYEYDEHIELECTLPAPNFLNSTNMSQIVDNAKNYAQALVDFEVPQDEDDAVKAEYTKLLIYDSLGSHVDQSKHKYLLQKARIKFASEHKSEED